MENWKIIALIVAGAIVLGALIGAIVGKHQVKKSRKDFKPIFSLRERLAYGVCLLLGIGFIAFGFFYPFPSAQQDNVFPDGMEIEGEMNPDMEGPAMTETPDADSGDVQTFDADDNADELQIEEEDAAIAVYPSDKPIAMPVG